MTSQAPVFVRRDSLVLVGDGQKALFLRNRGDAGRVQLVVEDIFERDNPPTREQGTDRPGRSVASVGVARSAMEEADWHHLEKERFAEELAKALYRYAHDNRFEELSSSLRRKCSAICARPFIRRWLIASSPRSPRK